MRLQKVLQVMADGAWHSDEEIANLLGCSVSSAGARVRDLRKRYGGGYLIERLNNKYRLIPNSQGANMSEVRSIMFVKPTIGEAVSYVPPNRDKWLETFTEVDKLLETLPPGKWIPVTVETDSLAMSLQHAVLGRGGYNQRRRKNIVFLQSTKANEPLPKNPTGHKGGRPKRAK